MAAQPMEDAEQEIAIRMLKDEVFRGAMLASPEATLKEEYGVGIPDGVRIQIHEETPDLIHIVVPAWPEDRPRVPDGELDDVIASMMASNPMKKTNCCTCGSSTSQTFNSFQKGCGC